MIGFNEYAEAYHLYRLLGISREMLAAFNLSDEELCARCEELPAAPTGRAARRNWWYQRLIYTVNCLRASGLFSFDFSGSDCKRHTYELLCRLPLQPEETDEADVPEHLLSDLSAERRQTVRRHYARLLRVEPMRQMFSQLNAYTKNPPGTTRTCIPAAAEYNMAKAPTLDLIDNGFSILSILIQQGEALFCDQAPRKDILYVPLALLKQGHSPQSILAAALIRQSVPDALDQFCLIPGGHIQLGLYGDTTPESFFRNVLTDQGRQEKPLLKNRSYHDFRLVQLTGEPGVEARQSPFFLQSDRQLEDLEGCWQKTAAMSMEELKGAPAKPALPDPNVENGYLRICDNGGQLAFRLLEAAHRQLRDDTKKDADSLLRDFLKNHYLFPDQLDIALSTLHQHIRAGLEAAPGNCSKGDAKQVSNINASAPQRMARLLTWWYLKQKPRANRVKLSTMMAYLREQVPAFQQAHASMPEKGAALPSCQWSPQHNDWLLTVGDK